MKIYKYKNVTVKAYNKEDARRKLLALNLFVPFHKLSLIKQIKS